jgi:hypothetical protein
MDLTRQQSECYSDPWCLNIHTYEMRNHHKRTVYSPGFDGFLYIFIWTAMGYALQYTSLEYLTSQGKTSPTKMQCSFQGGKSSEL